MRTFPLYDPKVYSILMFRLPKGREAEVQRTVGSELATLEGNKLEISYKGDWCIIESNRGAQSTAKDVSEVSPEMLKYRYDELMDLRRKLAEKLNVLTGGVRTYNYTLITCGSRERVWLKTFSDVSFLYKDKIEEEQEVLQTNVAYLNRILNRRGEIIVNSLRHSKVGTTLYVLAPPPTGYEHGLPRDMVIEVNLSDLRTSGTYSEMPIAVSNSTPYGQDSPPEKRLYQMRQNYLINILAVKSRLMELFLAQSQFLDMKETEVKGIYLNGKAQNDQIFSLQNRINEQMKLYVPKDDTNVKKKTFLERETYKTEKELLTDASIRFSNVSEVEHQIMRMSSRLNFMSGKVQDIARSILLEHEDTGFGSGSSSIGDLTLKEIDAEQLGLTSLLQELSRSRDILSSTIDVLRTFIDTRQRETSEDMSRLMNVLFLIFACIGIADALGNFVILGVQFLFLQDDPTWAEVLSATSLGLFITLFPILIAIIVLVLYFRKMR
ncbi:MAG: hypothetical protein MUC62_01350 [Candidatus Thermoplasmatota archaeon]|nr:hypothetical protein [Candidatus Thermoplasmatota archaeon]